jgi:hypothetical protein
MRPEMATIRFGAQRPQMVRPMLVLAPAGLAAA